MVDNIRTIVQDGETISLYSAMYGCTDEDIKKANNIKGDKLKEGQSLNIPIGKQWKLPASDDNVLDKKLSYFNDKVNEIRVQLYNPDLKIGEREVLEAQYIDLMNQKKERDKAASFTKSDNGINLVLEIKKDMTVSEFRELFPECTKNFYSYADKTNQLVFIQGEGFYASPDNVTLYKGDKFMIKSQEYAKDDGDNLWRSIKKTFGGRLDGK